MTTRSPYPGLRPFTEEESIFFRGREEHVTQIVNSLKNKKFIMITGASGDGKSSLVYAGLVPKAKAGFFKSTFKSWNVCDFRPEKSPFKNMCKSVSKALKIDLKLVENELQYGFSSLAELYKSSEFYFSEDDDEFQKLDAEARVNQRRKGANLLLIVDQFEEFFTNNENQEDGRPSNDSHLVANLLKNTVELAKEQDLPIYIVFTMRSDYIGNCASLRGIPELLGYSQYFIPRLNRDEISDVIRDPAHLNGDEIHARLVDQLVNSTSEGSDQLPIIQHCMNRVWRLSKGEMLDLNHLAYCHGIKISQLPKELKADVEKNIKGKTLNQENWGLENVINHHASQLFEQTVIDFIKEHPKYTEQEVKENLMFIFKGLIKIDEGKGVRYKCRFGELVRYLKFEMNVAQINQLILPFRLAGNDLLAPYSNQQPVLAENDTIEISHEALIRNWNALSKWAEEDAQNFRTFEDLRGQCEKWEENDCSNDYLLPIGPLDYFDKWLERNQPNVFWIKKFDDLDTSNQTSNKDVQASLNKIVEFVEKSRAYINASLLAKKRRRRLLMFIGSAAVLVLFFLTIWAFSEKAKSNEQKEIAQEAQIKSEKAALAAQKSEENALALSAKSDSLLRIALSNEKMAKEATKEAFFQKNAAEKSKLFALKQAKIAQDESNKTLKALDQLLEQKNLTESQRDSARMARIEAYELSLSAISKSLALQASRFEIAPQTSALMVFHAQKFNEEVEGDPYDASIHTGAMAALKKLKGNDYNKISGAANFSNDMRIDLSKQKIFGICNEGEITNWNYDQSFFNGVKLNGTSAFKLQKDNKALNAFYLDENHNAITYANGQIEIRTANEPKVTRLIGHENFVSQVKLLNDQLISSGNDGKIILWDQRTGKVKKEILMDHAISDFDLTNKTLSFISNERVGILDLETKQITSTAALKARPRTCLWHKTELIVTTDKGDILFLNKELKIQRTIKFSKVPIDKIDISPSGNFLAVGAADKRIGIFRLSYLDADPMIVDDIDSQIRTLMFADDNFLFAGLEDSELKFWCINPELIKEEICLNLKRQFTPDEWKKYIGDKVEYQKACEGG